MTLLKLDTDLKRKRLIGALLFVSLVLVFISLNRVPKLDVVGEDLELLESSGIQCFQGFCIDREPGTSFLSRWWIFSSTYLRLVSIGMVFAFAVSGLVDAFFFPAGTTASIFPGSRFRILSGMLIGSSLNLCSACVAPISSTFVKRGLGIEGSIALAQSSSTMNLPAVVMSFFIFTPLIGFSRVLMAVVSVIVIGPIVARALRSSSVSEEPYQNIHLTHMHTDDSSWKRAVIESFRDWPKFSLIYLLRMAPIMVAAGLFSGLVIQWVTPGTVGSYLGDDLTGVLIAASLGLLINVPLLFEIPLVALLLGLGAGTAAAATLLFAAAAGGPITFWILAKTMPKRGVAIFASGIWITGVAGGLAVLGFGSFIWEARVQPSNVRSLLQQSAANSEEALLLNRSDGASGAAGAIHFFDDVTDDAMIGFTHSSPEGEFITLGAGAIILDFNGDGLDDIYAVNSRGANALYKNDGDATFTDVALEAGVADPDGWGNGGCAADFDNDGYQDIYLTNYGRSILFSNSDSGTFVDVTERSGLQEPDLSYRTTGCAWGDYDSDGLLDLVVVRHFHEWKPNLVATMDFGDAVRRLALYRNVGQGGFEDVTSALGDTTLPTGLRPGQQVGNLWGAGFQPIWADLDDDGDLDLYVVNDFGFVIQSNVLWRNDGVGEDGGWRFHDVSQSSRADLALFGMGIALGDYDLDGDLDMYVTNMGQSVLLRNQGEGLSFLDVTKESLTGVPNLGIHLRVGWGAIFFDYDNDGDEDLYVISGSVEGMSNMLQADSQPNVLLRNEADGTFTNVSRSNGVNHSGDGRGGGFLDFDNDGCLDLYVANFGGDPVLLKNNCRPGNHWLKVRLVGSASNRDGIGARVSVAANGTTQIREISAGSGSLGQSSMTAHFGMGVATEISSVSVRWPSGRTQQLTGIAVDQTLTIEEP